MTDLETARRIFGRHRREKALDAVCMWSSTIVVGGFWILVVSWALIEAGR